MRREEKMLSDKRRGCQRREEVIREEKRLSGMQRGYLPKYHSISRNARKCENAPKIVVS